MKLTLGNASARGFSYLAVLIPLLIIGTVLAAYLKLVGTQNYAAARSQAWNFSLIVAESGVEEALAHLNSQTNNFATAGWKKQGQSFSKRTYIEPDIYYNVVIDLSNPNWPSINATGSVPQVLNRVR
jgi:Tfp pilus assembly protein PilX